MIKTFQSVPTFPGSGQSSLAAPVDTTRMHSKVVQSFKFLFIAIHAVMAQVTTSDGPAYGPPSHCLCHAVGTTSGGLLC